MRSNKNIFYVYTYVDPRNNEPFYVGKGKHQRLYHHLKYARSNPTPQRGKRFLNRIRKILREGAEPFVEKVFTNLSEREALAKEVELISELGRKDEDTGPLLNLTGGGIGGAISATVINEVHSRPEYRAKIRKRMKQRWSIESNREEQSSRIKHTWDCADKRREQQRRHMINDWNVNRESKTAKCRDYYKDERNVESIKARHAKISQTLKQTSHFTNNNPRAKTVQTPLGCFKSKRAAAIAHSMTQWKFEQLLLSEQSSFHIIEHMPSNAAAAS